MVRSFAYCCESFTAATRRAAGVHPITSPPVYAGTLDPGWFSGWDFLYFDLHGEPREAAWRGDDGIFAIAATQFPTIDLSGCVVFATTCFLADEESPMMDAILDAGARYVIAGEGRNWGPSGWRLYGAPLLGLWVRRWLGLGLGAPRALALAKKAVRLRGVAAQDTVEFRLYERMAQDDLC